MYLYIVYYSKDGTYSTIIAAAIHLNRLPVDHIPTKDKILTPSFFDRSDKKNIGHLIYHGQDQYNHFIYTINTGSSSRLLINAIQTVLDMIGKSKKEILCVDISSPVNRLIHIGSICAKRIRLVSLGQQIMAYGIQKYYSQILETIHKTKLKIAP